MTATRITIQTSWWIIFTSISLLFLGSTFALADEDDVTISNETLGNSCLTTIDINVTEDLAQQDDLLIDYNYSKIRREGVMMNVYYSNAMGQSQWTDFPPPTGIYLMPTHILIPLKTWLDKGVQSNGSWWVRIVLLKPGTC